MATNLKQKPPVGKSDHTIIALNCHCDPIFVENRNYHFEKGNYTKTKKILNETNWEETLNNLNVEEM